MHRLTPIAVLAGALSLGMAACAPHPIVARDPVPAPTGTESFTCGATYLPVNAVYTDCEPRQRYYEERAVIRSKG